MRYSILKNKWETQYDHFDEYERDYRHPFLVKEVEDLKEARDLCAMMRSSSTGEIVVYDNQSKEVISIT